MRYSTMRLPAIATQTQANFFGVNSNPNALTPSEAYPSCGLFLYFPFGWRTNLTLNRLPWAA